jgi:hypothetical protein
MGQGHYSSIQSYYILLLTKGASDYENDPAIQHHFAARYG